MKTTTTNCQICGINLTDPESIARGVGPDCAAKRASFIASCGTTDVEIASLEATGDAAARWVRNFRTEMRHCSARAAQRCIEAARREAGHQEATALGLKAGEYFEYVNRRAAGENAAAPRAEYEPKPAACEPPVPAIVVRQSERGFRVHPPYRHPQFVAAFKRTVSGRWYPEAQEWFIPESSLTWVIELLGHWFSMPVFINRNALQ